MVRLPGVRRWRRWHATTAVGRPAALVTFRSPLRSARLTSQFGLALGVTFAVCFLTGLISHLVQHPPGWFGWPSRPVQLYRVTQGLHVATGLASIPLLAAKLWSVYPRLFVWPPVRDPRHAVERLGVAALVAAALVEIVTGVLNIARWYTAMPFSFPAAHYWTAWLLTGAILTHVGVQLPVISNALRGPMPAPPDPVGSTGPVGAELVAGAGGLTRRGLLAAVGAACGVITVTTVGQTVAPLSPVALLAPRRPNVGPQRVPVNRSALAAGVVDLARDPGYRLVITGPAGEIRLTQAELAALPQHTASLPITCVEGWSADATWSGVRLCELARLAGLDPRRRDVTAEVQSLQSAGAWRTSTIAAPHVRDPLTLLALRLHGQPLQLDHGYPCRLIAPNRPGVLQTKWVASIRFRRSQ